MLNIFFLLVCAWGAHFFQQSPNGMEILRNVEQAIADVKDYTADVQAEVNMERMRIPKMRAMMLLKRPDKIDFKSESFAMLPREGMMLDAVLLRENYDAAIIGEDQLNGKKTFKLQLAAKGTTTRLRQMFLWVDPAHWTIVKMETIPYQGRVLTVELTYALQEGKYWLPQTLNVMFEAAGRDSSAKRTESEVSTSPNMDEIQRAPRTGSIKISYSNYKVNVGLTDEMFKRKDQQAK